MPKQAFAERMAQWERLKQGLDANAADLAFLETERDQITAWVANLAALEGAGWAKMTCGPAMLARMSFYL